MEIKIIKYKITQDFEKMLAEKDCQHQAKLKAENLERISNKDRLLPYILQMVESAYTVHNMRCNNSMSSTTGKDGLFGLRRVDIQKELKYILRDDCHGWSSDCSFFAWSFGGSGITTKIWLNDKIGAHVSTPNLEYSMTIIRKGNNNISNCYGKSIEREIENIIGIVANNYHDEW